MLDDIKYEIKTERKPYVAVFSDGKPHELTKEVWSLLSGYDLKFASVTTATELEEVASDAVLILIRIEGLEDDNLALAHRLSQDTRVVADIVAMTDEISIEERVLILSNGFDAIFNRGLEEIPAYKHVLLNRVEKGFTRLENRIQQEEYRRFKAALAASPDAFIVFDQNDKLFFVSEHYQNAYPLSGPRLVRGVPLMEAFRMCTEEEGVTPEDPRYAAMLKFWSTLDGQVEYRTDDGRFWHVKAKKLPGGQGTIVTTADITPYKEQQKILEENSRRLSEALEKEREASAIQKQFVNMVSHEFRTPLSIIDGNAQILHRRADTIEPADICKKTKTIRSAVSRLVNMMEGVLSSNMLRTGKLTPVPEPVDLGKLIGELCEEHGDLYTGYAISCKIDSLPERVMLDRKLITLIISNLLSNAVKFSKDAPKILVKGELQEGQIVITCEDNGIGIPSNEADKIFDRYYRSPTASGIPGSGIGLNLVRELVSLQGGSITVESEIEQGTKFVIFLPLGENQKELGVNLQG